MGFFLSAPQRGRVGLDRIVAGGGFRGAWALGIALCTAAGLLLAAASAGAQVERKGTVRGRIVSKDRPVEGNPVVLLSYTLDEKGQPKGGPVGRQVAGKDGSFTFEGVPIPPKSVFQLGTRIDGGLVGSGLFTFPADRNEVDIDLTVPEAGQAAERKGHPGGGLGIDQALLALEAGVGQLWVTEVIHIDNGGVNMVDHRTEPLLLPISPDAQNFDVMNQGDAHGGLSRDGATVKFFGQLPPGETTFAYRYSLPAFWGAARIVRRYNLPVGDVIVLSPPASMSVSGSGMVPRGTQRIQRTLYESWGRSDIPQNEELTVSVRGIPMSQKALLIPAGVFIVLMAGVVAWFLRRRLRKAGG